MTLVGDQIKGFPFFGFITLISDMDCDRSGKDIAKFLSLMRKIHIGGAAGPESQADGFHDVPLSVGNNPLDGVVQLRIGFNEVIFGFENDLLLGSFVEKFIKAAAQDLQDICQSSDGRGGQIPLQLGK